MLTDGSVTAPARRLPGPPSSAARRQLATFALAYLVYFGVRALTEGATWRAMDNATALIRLERDLGVAWEGKVQEAVTRSGTLVDLANAVYIYGHWPVLLGAGFLLFRHRRRHYYRLRDACLLTGLVGLVIFALFPVAPPRLTDLPMVDTVTRESEGYRQILPPGLVNEFAAMPSFHAGWNLLVGMVVFDATRHWLLRGFAVLMPAAMAFAVVATANHFVVDVVAGVIIVLAGLTVVRARERRRHRRRLIARDVHARRDARPVPAHGVRRRAPRRERPRAAAHRRDAPHTARRG